MEWISANEKLPKELQVVLVHGRRENEFYQGFGVAWVSNGKWAGCIRAVTHWMELPQAPNNGTQQKQESYEDLSRVKKRRLNSYERTRNAVYATGNKWAIENFHDTH